MNNYIGDPVGGIVALIQGMAWGIFFTYVGYCLLVFTVMVCYTELRKLIAGTFYFKPKAMANSFGFEFSSIRMSYYQPKVRVVYFYIIDNKANMVSGKLPDHLWVIASDITVMYFTMFHRRPEVYQGKLKGDMEMSLGKYKNDNPYTRGNDKYY